MTQDGCRACRVGDHNACSPHGCKCGHVLGSLQRKPQWPLGRENRFISTDSRELGMESVMVRRFMQTVEDPDFKVLEEEARKRRMTVQALIRSVIVPEFMKKHGLETVSEAEA